MSQHVLYRCKAPTDRICPCGKVARSLKEQGIEFETRRLGFSSKPEKREDVVALTGQPKVPVLVEPDGTVTHDSERILERVRSASS